MVSLEKGAEFHLSGFSPRSLAYLSTYGTLFVTDTGGTLHCYDVLSRKETSSSDLHSDSPVVCTVVKGVDKIVIARGRNLGARKLFNGMLLSNTILQPSALDSSCVVSLELPAKEVPLLLGELRARKSSSHLSSLREDLIEQLDRFAKKTSREKDDYTSGSVLSQEWNECCIVSGRVQHMFDLFEALLSKYRPPPMASRRTEPLGPRPAVAPILSAIRMRLALLLPSHGRILRLESGSEAVNANDIQLSYCEGIRRITFKQWPHKNYIWSVPRIMAAAGFYQVPATTGGVTSITYSRGDRTGCYTCPIFVYSWEATDEPWSEHNRHSPSCPHTKGEITVNVPVAVTEATHPAVTCPQDIVCISEHSACNMVATATTEGLIQIWDLDRALFLSEYARVDLHKVVATAKVDLQKMVATTKVGLQKVTPMAKFACQTDAAATPFVEATTDESCRQQPVASAESSGPTQWAKPQTRVLHITSLCLDGEENELSLVVGCTVKILDWVTPTVAVFLVKKVSSKPTVSAKDNEKTPASSNLGGGMDVSSDEAEYVSVGSLGTESSADAMTTMALASSSIHSSTYPLYIGAHETSSVGTVFIPPPHTSVPLESLMAESHFTSPVSVLLQASSSPMTLQPLSSVMPVSSLGQIPMSTPSLEPIPMPLHSFVPISMPLPSLGPIPMPVPSLGPMPIPPPSVEIGFDSKEGTSLPGVAELLLLIPLLEHRVDDSMATVPLVRQVIPVGQGVRVVTHIEYQDEEVNRGVLLAIGMKGEGPGASSMLISDSLEWEVTSSVKCVCPVTLDNLQPSSLLAVCRSGAVTLFSTEKWDVVGRYKDQLLNPSHCIFCPDRRELIVVTTEGQAQILQISVTEKDPEDNISSLLDESVPLSGRDSIRLLELMCANTPGVSISSKSSLCWEVVDPLHFHQHAPQHMFQTQTPENAFEGPLFNTLAWKYHPELGPGCRKHLFQLHCTDYSVPVSSVVVTLSFATSDCISNTATISLFQLQHSASQGEKVGVESATIEAPFDKWGPEIELLCGPIKIKQFVGISGQILSLTLTHPQLLQAPVSDLLLCFENLFPSNYSRITEEMLKVSNEEVKTEADSVTLRRRTLRSRLSKRPPISQKNLQNNIHTFLQVTVFGHSSSFPSPVRRQLLDCVMREEVVTKLVLASCRYCVEQTEHPLLSEQQKAAIMKRCSWGSKREGEEEMEQFRALEVLCWVASTAYCNADKNCFLMVVATVTKLLTSLLHACFVVGRRMLAHKCGGHLISILTRLVEDGPEFTSALSQSLISLIPTIVLFSSAASLHWLLRMIAHFSQTPLVQFAFRDCLQLLLQLAQQLGERSSLNSQVLQTSFHQEGTVLEPDLFDVYLSYYPKATVAKSSQPVTLKPNPLDADFYDVNYPPFPESATVMPTMHPISVIGRRAVQALPVPVGKPNPTIYDSELLLLLKGSSCPIPVTSSTRKEFATFRHGSFLLFSQRGLLETQPLEYSCLSVSPGATIKENTPKSAQDLSKQATGHFLLPPKSTEFSGYTFPSEKDHFTSSMHITSSSTLEMTEILDVAKDMLLIVDNLKPGHSYSAVIDFHCPVALTDISIQVSSYFMAVAIDVWLKKDGEKESVRVAKCSELLEKSLMIGNLSPPPICQFARVTYVARMNASHEKLTTSLGFFSGWPVLSESDIPTESTLAAAEAHLLAQYHGHCHNLEKSLSIFIANQHSPNHLQNTEEKRVMSACQDCYSAQVKLARFRHWARQLCHYNGERNKDSCAAPGQFSLSSKTSKIDLSVVPLKKLVKSAGCLVDTLLILTQSLPEESNLLCISEDDCRSLFSSLCITSTPKLYARPCALLISLCGSAPWWGKFIASTASVMFSGEQTIVFDKERAVLQFSALCQSTHLTSTVMLSILSLLAETLAPLTAILSPPHSQTSVPSSTVDGQLVHWLVLLVAHVLSSLTSPELGTENQNPLNLFTPSVIFTEELAAAELKADLDYKLERLHRKQERLWRVSPEPRDPPTKRDVAESGKKVVKMRLLTGGKTSAELKAELDQKLHQFQRVCRKLSVGSAEVVAMKRSEGCRNLSTVATPFSGQSRSSELLQQQQQQQQPVGSHHEGILKLDLPPGLVTDVVSGLMQFLTRLCARGEWEIVPVVCKIVTILLGLTRISITLSDLLTDDQLLAMIESICQQSDSNGNVGSGSVNYHWSCCALRTTLISVLACEKEHVIKTTSTSKSKKKERSQIRRLSSDLESAKKEAEEYKSVDEMVMDQGSPMLLSNDKEQVEVPLDKKDQKCKEESTGGVSDQPEPATASATIINPEKEITHSSTVTVSLQEHLGSLDTKIAEQCSHPPTAAASPAHPTTMPEGAEEARNIVDETTTEVNFLGVLQEETSKSLMSTGSDAGEPGSALSEGTLEPSDSLSLSPELKTASAKDVEAVSKISSLPAVGDSHQCKGAIPSTAEEKVKDPSSETLKSSVKHKPRLLVSQSLRSLVHIPEIPVVSGTEKGKPHVAYSSYIISNSTDHRLQGRVAFPAEMQLQTMSQQVYETLLRSIQYATPQSFEMNGDSPQLPVPSKATMDSKGSLSLLLPALERAFLAAISQQGSTVSVLSLLQFWTEIGYVTMTVIKKKWLSALLHSSPSVAPTSIGKPSLQLRLVSPGSLSLLLDKLLETSMQDVHLWQLSISLLHLHAKFCKKAHDAMVVDVDKLHAVLMRYCIFQESELEQQCQESNQDLTFSKLLTGIAYLRLRGESRGVDNQTSGAHFLLRMLTMIIEARSRSSLTSPRLQCLVRTLTLPKVLSQLFLFLPFTTPTVDVKSIQAECFALIKKFIRVVVSFLLEVTSPSPSLPVTVYGAMADGDRSRRVYYTATTMPELKWVQLNLEHEEKGRGPMTELLQLLKVILSTDIPDAAYSQLEATCSTSQQQSELDPLFGKEKGYHLWGGDFAVLGKPLLNLVYTDQSLLASLLYSVTPTHKTVDQKMPHHTYNLFEGFVSFLKDNCRDFSCFVYPLLSVLDAAASSGQSPHSDIFLNILGGFAHESDENKEKESDEGEREKEHSEKLLQFISQGGGRAVLRCLINSCCLQQAAQVNHTLYHAISNLGQQEMPKPYKEGSDLVNFLPTASVKLSPGRISAKDLQSVTLKDQLGRASALHHNFQEGEHWLKMSMSLPQPIMLHSIHIYQPLGLSQSGPSAIRLELASVSKLSRPSTISPLLKTAGLNSIRLQLKNPVVAQDLVLHFQRPMVSENISFSHMLLLGIPYGTASSKENQVSLPPAESHQSEGWLEILIGWLSLGSEVTDQLVSCARDMTELLPSCVSLLNKNLSPKVAGQLENFLHKLADQSSDSGLSLVYHMFRYQHSDVYHAHTTTPTSDVMGSYHVDLLYRLCAPVNERASNRLLAALRVLSDLLSPSMSDFTPSSHLPALIRAVSSALGRGQRTVSTDQNPLPVEVDVSEELFRSLLDATLLFAVDHPLKQPMNCLLSALCHHNLHWFPIIMTTTTDIFQNELETTGKVLNTLAAVSLSDQCIPVLLDSELLLQVLDRLTSFLLPLEGLVTGDSLPANVETCLPNVCLLLAFLTDLASHPRLQTYLLAHGSHRVWPLCLRMLDAVRSPALDFCQHVVREFFAACLSSNTRGKCMFVRLLINSLRGEFSTEELDDPPSSLQLTPILHSLLVNLVLAVEPVTVVLDASAVSFVPSTTVTHMHNSASFGPTYPVGVGQYHMKVTVETSLDQVAQLFAPKVLVKPEVEKPPEPTRIKAYHDYVAASKKHTAKKSPVPAIRFDFSTFEMAGWNLSLSSNTSDNGTKSVQVALFDSPEVYLPLSTKFGAIEPSKLLGHGRTRGLVIRQVMQPPMQTTPTIIEKSETLLQEFMFMGGLGMLGVVIPHVYSRLWPPYLPASDLEVDVSSISRLEPCRFLPPHSLVMLALGLRLPGYGDVLTGNQHVARTLLRGMLGAEEESSIQFAAIRELPFIPFMILLEVLRKSPLPGQAGHDLRCQLGSVGVVSHLLHCLAIAGNHSPRVRNEKDQTGKSSISAGLETKRKKRSAAVMVTSTKERQYWAKGTGFGTGSTSSTWDIEAMMAKQQSEELLVSICFSVLAEYLHWPLMLDVEQLEVFPVSVMELLSESCLLPALASYLINDSVLDISQHIQLYQAVMSLLDAIADNPQTHQLLMLAVHGNQEASQPGSPTLANVFKKLEGIARRYSKTMSLSKLSLPEQVHPQETPTDADHDNALPISSVPPPVPSKKETDPVPILEKDEEAQLIHLMKRILTVWEKVSNVVVMLQSSPLSPDDQTSREGSGICASVAGSDELYVEVMKPVQFDTYTMTEEDGDDSSVTFKVPFYFSQKVEYSGSSVHLASRAQRLAQEIVTLSSSLPFSPSSSVFVRCDEERLDIMKVLITGPSDTPYANGCFEFDIFFPLEYPNTPMQVNLVTTGQGSVRFNPNLYNDGKVCLSILNTWHGRPEEKWNPQNSSLLQVLVSIQSLILVPEPYFNEPGYEQHRGTPYGDHRSLTYNANICMATLQWAIINSIRNPSPCFKQVILKHFYLRKEETLAQCERWKKELSEGIQRLQSKTINVQALNDYLRNIGRLTETLKAELAKINPKDFTSPE